MSKVSAKQRAARAQWTQVLGSAKGLLAVDAPRTWTDHAGGVHPTPSSIQRRLKFSRCPLHARLREFVLSRDGWRCQACGLPGAPGRWVRMDHIISHRNGGAHHPANLQALCESCNARKSGLIDTKAARR